MLKLLQCNCCSCSCICIAATTMDHYEGTATLKLVQKLGELHEANQSASGDIPYFIITNDLCHKVVLVLTAFAAQKFRMSKADAIYLLDTLLETYDDPPAPSCCAFYHSQTRDKMNAVRSQVLPILPED